MLTNKKTDDLNDPLDDLFAGAGTPTQREAARPARPDAARHAEDTQQGYFDKCHKCGGSGLYYRRSQHGSRCFACQGAGGRTYKTSPEHRAAHRAKVAERKQARAQKEAAERTQEAVEWRAQNPEAAAWLASNGSDFAASLRGALEKWGHLTDNQLAAVHRSIERDAERKREAEARAAAARTLSTEGVDRLKEAFDRARTYAAERGRGLKAPRITIGRVVITPAGASSANPGALYVKAEGTYLGKVKDGRFYRSRECSDEQEKRVLAFVADPKAAAIAYGLETGVCCVCNAELTNKESIERGIGPICAAKFGW